MSYYLAIDLGTTGCRSIVFDSKLNQIGDCYREYDLILGQDGWVEQDANLWWKLTKDTISGALYKSGIHGKEISGIGISSQAITIVPINDKFEPLYNAISWLDTRAVKQADFLAHKFGQKKIFAETGKRIDPTYSLPKILWLKEERPEIFSHTWKFASPMDFLAAKLTGQCFTDHTMASGTLLYDITSNRWNKSILDDCGLSEEQIPELKWAGEVAGVAGELCVNSKCVVAVGAQDQRCASLGAGLRKGTMTVSLGTSGAICKYWDHVQADRSDRIGWSAYVNEGSWVTEGVVNTAAVCMRWLRDTMFRGESYETISREAEKIMSRGTSLMFYPYLNGPGCPDYYSSAEGNFYGISLSTERADFALAVMEGVAFQIRIILEAMEAYGEVQKLILFGGGAKSEVWCQIIANITGMNVATTETSEAAGVGAAILAGIATGEFSRQNTPAVAEKRLFVPDKTTDDYEEKFMRYRKIACLLWERKETDDCN